MFVLLRSHNHHEDFTMFTYKNILLLYYQQCHCVDRGLILDLLAHENFELMRRTQKWCKLSLHSIEKK